MSGFQNKKERERMREEERLVVTFVIVIPYPRIPRKFARPGLKVMKAQY